MDDVETEQVQQRSRTPKRRSVENKTSSTKPAVVKMVLPTRSRIGDRVPQHNELYIGRGNGKFLQSKWCNPYRLQECTDRAECLRKFEEYANDKLVHDLAELSGKILLCH